MEGSEQGGFRPVVIVSRDIINAASSVVMVVPCTTYREGRRIYPSQVLVSAPEGGLTNNSVLLAEQVRVLDKRRLMRLRGTLGIAVMQQLDRALLIALDLPGQ